MNSISTQDNHILDIQADVKRDFKCFTDPDNEEFSLNELKDLILTALKRSNNEGIASYGYRINRDKFHGEIHIVGRNDKGHYNLIRVFSAGGEWRSCVDVPWGPASEVFDYMTCNWLP